MKRPVDNLPPELEDSLRQWLESKNIPMSPLQWVNKCLKDIGYTDKDTNTTERFRRSQSKKEKKHNRRKKR